MRARNGVVTVLSVVGEGEGSRPPETSSDSPFEVLGGAQCRRADKLLDLFFMASQSGLIQTKQNLHLNVIQP